MGGRERNVRTSGEWNGQWLVWGVGWVVCCVTLWAVL